MLIYSTTVLYDYNIVLFLQVDTSVHIGEVRVMLQFVRAVADTSKSRKEKCYFKVWIRQASGLKTRYNNGSFVLWLVIIVCSDIVVLYIRDHEGSGFSGQQYYPKSSLTTPSWHLGSIG